MRCSGPAVFSRPPYAARRMQLCFAHFDHWRMRGQVKDRVGVYGVQEQLSELSEQAQAAHRREEESGRKAGTTGSSLFSKFRKNVSRGP